MKVIRDGDVVYVAKHIRIIRKQEIDGKPAIVIYLGNTLQSNLIYNDASVRDYKFEKMVSVIMSGYSVFTVLGIVALNFVLSYLFVQLFK